jgi:hypothetical protein
MKNFRWLAGAATVLALAGINASADVITNFPVKDSGMFIGQCDGRQNRGAGPRIECTVATNVPGATGDGTLIKFDLRPSGVSVVPVGHVITNAQLRLRSYSGANNTKFKHYVVAYPLLADWGEGNGTNGAVNGGLPWYPVTVGDATPRYKYVTEVDTGTNMFAVLGLAIDSNSWGTSTTAVNNWKNCLEPLAKDGVLWNTYAGRGIGTDVADRQMMNYLWISDLYPNNGKNYGSTGAYLPSLEFAPEGLKVLQEWANGTLVNNGFNFWAVCPPNNMLTNQTLTGRAGSREGLTTGGVTTKFPPELVLFTAVPPTLPNPRTLLIFR